MYKKLLSASVAVVVGASAGYAVNALAQQKPEVLLKQRQGAMALQGKYFGPLNAMAQGKAPYNAQIVVRNAGYLQALSEMPWDGFTPETKDEKSRALPAVWTDTAQWKEAQERFLGAVAKLVAAKGDEGAAKAAIGEVGKACGACHDHFRAK
jgi:cytochrome c556